MSYNSRKGTKAAKRAPKIRTTALFSGSFANDSSQRAPGGGSSGRLTVLASSGGVCLFASAGKSPKSALVSTSEGCSTLSLRWARAKESVMFRSICKSEHQPGIEHLEQ